LLSDGSGSSPSVGLSSGGSGSLFKVYAKKLHSSGMKA
jgi:hypothetical protein